MKSKSFSFIGLILSCIFAGIACVLCFSVFDILSQPFFELKLLFAFVNIIIVMVLSCFSGALSNKLTMPMFIVIAVTTGIYTIIQFAGFVLFSLFFLSEQISWYVLFQLVLHLIYFAIVLPIGKAGYNLSNKSSNHRDVSSL